MAIPLTVDASGTGIDVKQDGSVLGGAVDSAVDDGCESAVVVSRSVLLSVVIGVLTVAVVAVVAVVEEDEEVEVVVVVVVVVVGSDVVLVVVLTGVVVAALVVSAGTIAQSTKRTQLDVALQNPCVRWQFSRKPPQLPKQQLHHWRVLTTPKPALMHVGHTSTGAVDGTGVAIAGVVPSTVAVVVDTVAASVVVAAVGAGVTPPQKP